MSQTFHFFSPGMLWSHIVHQGRQAQRHGAVQSIDTVYQFLEDAGIRFLVRIVTSLAHKQQARQQRPESNPFLPPYDQHLYVADVSETHVCLLNKFNVVDHHVLIITRSFEAQESLLTPADFDAWLRCLHEFDSLGFYNGGGPAGASQPHKHLQLVPLPLAPSGPRIPIEPLMTSSQPHDGWRVLPSFPFTHVLAYLDSKETEPSEEGANRLWESYVRMLHTVGLFDRFKSPADLRIGPYNLLLTKQWMLLVPRSVECFGPISVNALGFAGALLVKNVHELQMLEDHGPLEALRRVSVP